MCIHDVGKLDTMRIPTTTLSLSKKISWIGGYSPSYNLNTCDDFRNLKFLEIDVQS